MNQWAIQYDLLKTKLGADIARKCLHILLNVKQDHYYRPNKPVFKIKYNHSDCCVPYLNYQYDKGVKIFGSIFHFWRHYWTEHFDYKLSDDLDMYGEMFNGIATGISMVSRMTSQYLQADMYLRELRRGYKSRLDLDHEIELYMNHITVTFNPENVIKSLCEHNLEYHFRRELENNHIVKSLTPYHEIH